EGGPAVRTQRWRREEHVMSVHQAFLHDICEHPDDDTPRLIYADWLDDHDDPARGEFIRLQCRLEALRPDDESWPALRERELELLKQHGDRWKEPLRPLTRWCHFRRGFVEHVSLRPRTFFTHSAD